MDKWCGEIRIKAKGEKVWQPHGIYSCLDKIVQYLIIPVKDWKDPPFYMPWRLRQIIMMTVLALVAAELLISPSVADYTPAFETFHSLFFFSFSVLHIRSYVAHKDDVNKLSLKVVKTWFFFFLTKFFSFLYKDFFSADIEFFLTEIKKKQKNKTQKIIFIQDSS